MSQLGHKPVVGTPQMRHTTSQWFSPTRKRPRAKSKLVSPDQDPLQQRPSTSHEQHSCCHSHMARTITPEPAGCSCQCEAVMAQHCCHCTSLRSICELAAVNKLFRQRKRVKVNIGSSPDHSLIHIRCDRHRSTPLKSLLHQLSHNATASQFRRAKRKS